MNLEKNILSPNENTQTTQNKPQYNHATRIVAAVFGSLIGLSGINHGICETTQGFKPTNGFFIFAIAPGNNWSVWTEGGEAAFTVIPNLLITGLLAIIVGLFMVIWSIGFIHQPQGVRVFLFLALLLFIFGGGIGQIIFFPLEWYVASKINQPLSGWQKILSSPCRRVIKNWWRWTLPLCAILFLITLEIAIFGYVPGVSDHDQLKYICWSFLGGVILLLVISFVSSFAHDIENRKTIV